CQALASQVNLMQWKALEIGPDSVTELKGLDPAHYYFATLAIEKALKGRDPKFLAQWIGKIQESPWNRTNADTVISAYHCLTGDDLKAMLSVP
ncbi:MAG: hypothetical protein KDL87_15980, partial [Verrucomicrobiae bacterium]|nr:hypothetical protein [Verrucomicrobiae bacterium]